MSTNEITDQQKNDLRALCSHTRDTAGVGQHPARAEQDRRSAAAGFAVIAAYESALAEVERKRLALENVKALAKRMRHKGDIENAGHLLRFCEQGGQPESVMDILRGEAKP